MMAKNPLKDKKDWLRFIEEIARRKAEEEKKKAQDALNIPYLPRDCISNILVRLPLESLQSSRFVCKEWYGVVNSSPFIKSHFRRSEFVLLFTAPVIVPSSQKEKRDTCLVEHKILQQGNVPMFNLPNLDMHGKRSIKYLEMNRHGESKIGDFNTTLLDSSRILASCNGLVLIKNSMGRGGLVVMNLVTRDFIALPVGTLCSYYTGETYEFVFSKLASRYKVVHLFRDELHYVGCEIFSVGVGEIWRVMKRSITELQTFDWFDKKSVSAINALHWLPGIDIRNGSNIRDYVLSMDIEDEMFHTVPLPKSPGIFDGIVELKGDLCYLRHDDEINQIEIWTLKGLHGEKWVKEHQIRVGCVMDMVPYFCSKSGDELLLTRREDGSFYAYNFQERAMIQIEIPKECSSLLWKSLPHINSLLNWSPSGRNPDVLR